MTDQVPGSAAGLLRGVCRRNRRAGGRWRRQGDRAGGRDRPRSGFSFAAYGDSRPMMYLPHKDGQPDLTQLFVEMFGLVMPEKIAEAVVKGT